MRENPFNSLNDMNYSNNLTASVNTKGVLDIDTVKGCYHGMKAYPSGGCYGLCYASKIADFYGYDFSQSVVRSDMNRNSIENIVIGHYAPWFRIGTMGDPSYDWDYTVWVCEWLGQYKTPVVVSKHWIDMSCANAKGLERSGAVVNTSISPLDSDVEIEYRLNVFDRLNRAGVKSLLRVVTARFGDTSNGVALNEKQENIMQNKPVIDNPLRIPGDDVRVLSGDIISEKNTNAVGGGKSISIESKSAYVGKCNTCPDQCGVDVNGLWVGGYKMAKASKETTELDFSPSKQIELFTDKIEFEYVKSVIGSGYEDDVAKLAIEDKVAYRAARKNMQIHSAIILKINYEFSGFFTFQVNHDAREFCLLQSAMRLDRQDKDIYSQMVQKIIDQNTYSYPMIMTVSTKHPLECPKVFRVLGFETYLILSGFEYMVYGKLEDVRMKRLAHATMTNAWTTTRADWLKMKKEWNGKIEDAGEKHDIPNPKFASRDGCWQGSNGYSNVVLSKHEIVDGKATLVKGKSFNGNASVLDPVACEVILRFFMPTAGRRVYNPFGGGVQFGFVSGSYGYEYIASEIRQNQCDANNILCKDLDSAKWIQSDSSTYEPEGKFDLCFTCPPYYGVEKYIDYEGIIPEGELNTMPTYDEFRDTLFAGYRKAIESLNDNRFFVVMTGDSRGKNGAYYGCEAEHELFFRDNGLHIYNKIVYLEAEFTRLAHAKRTLDYRKFPKREQKIIVAYKGDMSVIKDTFPRIGRL
jgi:hypothetical protein